MCIRGRLTCVSELAPHLGDPCPLGAPRGLGAGSSRSESSFGSETCLPDGEECGAVLDSFKLDYYTSLCK